MKTTGIERTGFASYCINGITEGCRYCVAGKKLVLFITGKCPRNCFYCSLSNKRKNNDIIFANERRCYTVKDAVNEAKESNAEGAGITGGDPLLFLERTIKYAKALKNKFGKRFHIHIYLPTKLVTREKLKRLSSCVDEIRFHPAFLAEKSKRMKEDVQKDMEKIKLANLFFKKENIGCEFPVLPEKKKKEIFEFIRIAQKYLGFVNLNELEISDTNFDYVIKHYSLNKDTYTIAGSKQAGLWILKQCVKANLKVKVHVCTAETKNQHQYKNRLKLHEIMPYGYMTDDGSVRYFAICAKNKQQLIKIARELGKFRQIYIDKRKKRVILSEKIVPLVIKLKKYKIARVEEFPTFDRTEVQFEHLG